MNIKKSLEPRLRKWPLLYRLGAAVYSTLQPVHLQELFIGTKAQEMKWARRHLHKGGDWENAQRLGDGREWVAGYWGSRDHSHRAFLLEKIAAYSPFSTVLEIGCNCGPNLYLVAKKFPDAEIRGVDINPGAVKKGNELLAQEGISNVGLFIGKADELGQFQDKSFDIVVTDSLLMYIGPDKIKKVIEEMVRITRRALILLERHCFQTERKDQSGLGVYRYCAWERDYVALLSQFVPREQIHITKIPEGIWPESPRWQKMGAAVEVIMEQGKEDA